MNSTYFGIFYKEHFESPVLRCNDKIRCRNTVRFPLILPKTYLTRRGPLMLYTNGMTLPKLKLSGTKGSKVSEGISGNSSKRTGLLPPLKPKEFVGGSKKEGKLPALKAEALPSVSSFRQSVLEYRDKNERRNGAFWEIVNGKYKAKDSLFQKSSRTNYNDKLTIQTRSSLTSKKTGLSLEPVTYPKNAHTPANSRSPTKIIEYD